MGYAVQLKQSWCNYRKSSLFNFIFITKTIPIRS